MAFTGREVGWSVTENDQAAPLAACVVRRCTVEVVGFKREGDAAVGCTFCEELTTASDDQRRCVSALTGHAFYYGTGLNGEGLTVVHEYVSVEEVDVIA